MNTYQTRTIAISGLASALLPTMAHAQTFEQVIGLFNIFVGFMVAAAFIAYGTGLIVYFVRIGTVQRADGIRIMEQGVVILFVLVVLLALVQYFQSHPAIGAAIIAGVVALLILWAIIAIAAENGEKKEEH